MSIQVTAHGNRLASVGQKIVITVNDDIVSVKAPFYRRTIPIADISAVNAVPDDGKNRGFLNWFVTGRADSSGGVRINTGGSARIDILTNKGARYGIVVDTMNQATQIVNAIKANSSALNERPTIS